MSEDPVVVEVPTELVVEVPVGSSIPGIKAPSDQGNSPAVPEPTTEEGE